MKNGTKTLAVNNGSLFRVALREYGDALQWERIARASGLTDPLINGLTILKIPPRDQSQGTGGAYSAT